ncbi:MAG: cation transporter [Chloroflexi bacterium]|nr:cation transporter [Chloroflexota bacterium]
MRPSLTRFAWLSLGAAVCTIGLKSVAYMLTGSVGLLSDALESFVNLVGALMALAMLTIAARPADEDHAYGHDKAEYFSSGVEGTLILVAALSIGVAAIQRLTAPRPLEQIGLGLIVSLMASLINLGAALYLMRTAKRYTSITLEANAQHLLTDVWTSIGVLAGVGAVALTGWEALDSLVAILVAANILWTGFQLVGRSVLGLMDTSLPHADLETLQKALDPFAAADVQFHALRTRQSGARQFVFLHVLVPGEWTIRRGHQLLEKIEASIRRVLPGANVSTHIEPLDEPASWDDVPLDHLPDEGADAEAAQPKPRNPDSPQQFSFWSRPPVCPLIP